MIPLLEHTRRTLFWFHKVSSVLECYELLRAHMAENKASVLVDGWQTIVGLNLSGDQKQKLKALIKGTIENISSRRDEGRKLAEKLDMAVRDNDQGAIRGLLKHLREGLYHTGESRERFLDEFDKILQPDQRARVFLYLFKRAKDANKPVEQIIDGIIMHGDDS